MNAEIQMTATTGSVHQRISSPSTRRDRASTVSVTPASGIGDSFRLRG